MSGDYYDYQRELRRLQRHRETFINNIEVAKILPTLCESEAFTKRDETEVRETCLHGIRNEARGFKINSVQMRKIVNFIQASCKSCSYFLCLELYYVFY